MSLTINLATRGRPELLIDTVARTLPNIARDDTVFMISVDRDDLKTIRALHDLPRDKRIMPIVLDREDSFGGKFNRALIYAPADVYTAMVDYAPHVTPAFDQKILDAAAVFPDNIGVVYNRLICASLPAINGITAGLAKHMGYLYPTYFPFSFVDLWMDDIVRLIDRISFADVIIDRAKREPTMGRRDVKFWGVLLDLLMYERLDIARRVLNAPENRDPPWRKELAERRFQMVVDRSQMVSAASRQNAAWNDRYAAFESAEEEERYNRIKAKGDKLMRELYDKEIARRSAPEMVSAK